MKQKPLPFANKQAAKSFRAAN